MDYRELKQKYNEVLDKRTSTSKTFDKGNGSYTLVASRTPIHYTDENGSFQEIDLNIVDGRIEKNFYKVELLTDCIGYSIVSRQDNSRIDVKLRKIGIKDIEYSSPTVSGNKAYWYDVDTDVDFFIEFRGYRTRCWKVLKSANAATDITFEVFEDDTESKDLRVIDKIVGYDAKNRPTITSKDKSIETKSVTEVSKKNIKSYNLKQTFTNKVVQRDKTTRVKSEVTDIEYPVYIDADVEVSIGNTADDGRDDYVNNPAPSSNLYTMKNYNGVGDINAFGGFVITQLNSFTRFDGITIPQAATIDDATLNLYAVYSGSPMSIKGYAFDENDPNAPTAPGDIRNKTTGIASNNVTTQITNIMTSPATKNMFDLYGINVAPIVQELVNSYDYSNEAMMFFYRSKSIYSGFVAVGIYDYTWGTTKAPELVIDYTASAQTEPSISLSESSFSPTTNVNGSNPSDDSFTITNPASATTLDWYIDLSGDASWISVSPSGVDYLDYGETPETITVSYDTQGMQAGVYNNTISVLSTSASNSPQTIDVELTIDPYLEVSVDTIVTSAASSGAGPVETFTLENPSGGTVTWTITNTQDWLSISPDSGTTTTETDTISASFFTYETSAALSITSGSTIDFDDGIELSDHNDSWTNLANAFDENDSTFASVIVTTSPYANTLQATSTNNTISEGVITKLEIGIRFVNEGGAAGADANFDLSIDGGSTFPIDFSGAGTWSGSSPITIWMDITNDVDAPETWTWDHINNMQLKYHRPYNIDQDIYGFYVRVEYSPLVKIYLADGLYEDTITITSDAWNSPQTIDVDFTIGASGETPSGSGGPGSPIAKQLHYRKGGVTYNINLYSTTTDMVDYVQLRVDGSTVYAPLDTTGNSQASDLRIRKGGTTYAFLTEWAAS